MQWDASWRKKSPMFRKALCSLGKCNQKPEVHFPHNKIDSIVLLRILRNQCNCQSYNCQIKSWVQRDLQIMNFTHKLQSKQKLMYTAEKFDTHTASNIWFYPYLGTTYACQKNPARNLCIFVFGDRITQCSFTSTSLFFPCYRAGIMGKKKLN